MKIMSFNTQHCLSYTERKINFELMADTIVGLGADIVGLNEIRGEGEHPEYTAQTERLASLAGYEHFFFSPALYVPGGGLYGNAVLSKYPILSAEIIPVPEAVEKTGGRHYEPRCLLKAKLSCGLTVMAIHFGLNPDEQMQAVRTVVENSERENCILMGDFNVTPDAQVLEPIRKLFYDTADKFDAPKLSFPSDKPRSKIDYILVSPDIKVISADIPAIVASDHRPHVAEIEF